MEKILIIGGDSRLGKIFYNNYKKKYKIYRTSRKKKFNYFLDLKKVKNFQNKIKFDYVLFIAGIVDYQECEKNFYEAKKVNCINIPFLAKKFLKQGSHVIFISTNTVFKSKKKKPKEIDKTNPSFNYSKLKDMTEKKLLILKKNFPKISILRLTKNIDKNTKPFDNWIKILKKTGKINAFQDLYFAPILFEDSAKIIHHTISKNLYGIFHLSGKKDMNYCQFAKLLLKKFNRSNKYLRCVTSKSMNVNLVYNHQITSLDMKYTTRKTTMKPIHVSKIINYLSKSYN